MSPPPLEQFLGRLTCVTTHSPCPKMQLLVRLLEEGCQKKRALGGIFAQRGHSTNYFLVYPRNTPANHPPTEACMIHSKPHRGCRMQDPGSRGYRWWKTADFSHSASTAHSAPPWYFGGGSAVRRSAVQCNCTFCFVFPLYLTKKN